MTSVRPRVSIGLPVYNAENFLAAALDNWLAQTFADFELVISDNASTDGTEAICLDYGARDDRIRYERQPENRGLVWNFNHVFRIARGELFAWAAHDDLRDPSYLERTIQSLDEDPDAVLCHAATSEIDERGNVLSNDECIRRFGRPGNDMTPSAVRERSGKLAAPSPAERLFGVLMYTSSCDEVYGVARRAALEKTNLLQPYFGSDMLFVTELALEGRLRTLPERLFFSRMHHSQASHLPTETDRQRWLVGPAVRRFVVPRKVRYPWELFRAILRAELSVTERLGCLAVLARFGLQTKKWKRVLSDVIPSRKASHPAQPSA